VTTDIALVLAILLASILLFFSEKLRVDVVALLVLASLVISGLVTPEQAVSGFSNPAVITVWAVFMLSGGLSRTGIANMIGKQVLRLAGHGEKRLLVVIMLTAGVMSAFMNNIGVAALMLPVVLDIGRKTDQAPSKLLMPLVFGALLGGTLTLIGTPPNILISDALLEANLEPFGFFDYTAPGSLVLLAGIAYMVLVGRRLLPDRDPMKSLAGRQNNNNSHELQALNEQLAEIEIPADSGLAGKTLAESRIGAALGLNILAVVRNGRRQLAPQPETILRGGDQLLALGKLNRLESLSKQPNLIAQDRSMTFGQLLSGPLGVAEFRVEPDSPYPGKSLAQLDIRRLLGVNVLAIRRNQQAYRVGLPDFELQEGDWLLVQGEREMLDMLDNLPGFRVPEPGELETYSLPESLLVVSIPAGSVLEGQSLASSQLGKTFGLTVFGLTRDGVSRLMPDPDTELNAGDELIVEGDPRDLAIVRCLEELVVRPHPIIDLEELTSGPVALVQAVLSPFTTLANKTFREIHFRDRYGLNVLAVWRGGRPYRSNLGEMALRMGDALLLYGSREKIRLLGNEPDFLVLQEDAQVEPRTHKAPVAGLLMAAVVVTVLLGWLPISIAAVIGATLMVISGSIDMDEAYRYVEWKAVFLIAGMLPLGIAMAETGAAAFMAEGMVDILGGYGPRVVLGGLFTLALLATLIMPNPVVAVLLAPIALNSAAELGVSPFSFMIGVAFGASASFLSPVGHPANVLVMGPGGYRFSDYIKTGLPLAFVLLLVVVLFVPFFWPMT
jgi:di/tricarboxylate transporter